MVLKEGEEASKEKHVAEEKTSQLAQKIEERAKGRRGPSRLEEKKKKD